MSFAVNKTCTQSHITTYMYNSEYWNVGYICVQIINYITNHMSRGQERGVTFVCGQGVNKIMICVCINGQYVIIIFLCHSCICNTFCSCC